MHDLALRSCYNDLRSQIHGIGKALSFQVVSERMLVISTNQATVLGENVKNIHLGSNRVTECINGISYY